MLVLSRKPGQKLVIDDNITIIVQRISGNRVSIGIEAPSHVHIMRGELQKIRREFEDENTEVFEPSAGVSLIAELDQTAALADA